MRPLSIGIGIGFLLAVAFIALRRADHTRFLGAATERDKTCEQFGPEHRRQLGADLEADFRFYKITDFYSLRLDTCVETLESEVENEFTVVDISGGFIKRSLGPLPAPIGDMGQTLFDCDTSGVDHTLIEKVREHRGYVWGVPYAEYMDDFNGGPPRTVKHAARMYTRRDCAESFHRELQEVR